MLCAFFLTFTFPYLFFLENFLQVHIIHVFLFSSELQSIFFLSINASYLAHVLTISTVSFFFVDFPYSYFLPYLILWLWVRDDSVHLRFIILVKLLSTNVCILWPSVLNVFYVLFHHDETVTWIYSFTSQQPLRQC